MATRTLLQFQINLICILNKIKDADRPNLSVDHMNDLFTSLPPNEQTVVDYLRLLSRSGIVATNNYRVKKSGDGSGGPVDGAIRYHVEFRCYFSCAHKKKAKKYASGYLVKLNDQKFDLGWLIRYAVLRYGGALAEFHQTDQVDPYGLRTVDGTGIREIFDIETEEKQWKKKEERRKMKEERRKRKEERRKREQEEDQEAQQEGREVAEAQQEGQHVAEAQQQGQHVAVAVEDERVTAPISDSDGKSTPPDPEDKDAKFDETPVPDGFAHVTHIVPLLGWSSREVMDFLNSYGTRYGRAINGERGHSSVHLRALINIYIPQVKFWF